jgi:stage III sporulation protein AA
MITAKITPQGQVPASAFEQTAFFLPMYKDKLLSLSPAIREKTQEIRLRSGQPVTLETGSGTRHYVDAAVTTEHLRELIELFCDYSVHSYTEQFAQGFITLGGGHRAGFCGTAVVRDGCVTAVRGVTSVNLRIAREFIGCSDVLYEALNPMHTGESLLIIGKPVSAKTTVLRDFARRLSQERKVSIIDERGEIAGKSFNVGMNTDVLSGFPKKAGFVTALRAMSPDFIVCDEIAGDGGEVRECLNCGAGLIMTAHCGGLEEALRSAPLAGIIPLVTYIALLGTGKNIGQLQGLWRKDNTGEGNFRAVMFNRGGVGRAYSLSRA